MRPLIAVQILLVLGLVSCGPSDGAHQDHYPSGKVKEEGAYKNGEKVGKGEDLGDLCERKTLCARTSQGFFLRFRSAGGAVSGLIGDGKEPG